MVMIEKVAENDKVLVPVLVLFQLALLDST